MRLQKFMAEAGVASRRQCEQYILAGRVRVNGEIAALGSTVDPAVDSIFLDDKQIFNTQRRVVILFYKPRGVVCTSNDPEGRKTVQSYFNSFDERLYNVGRLDIYSEGLLIMTNDGNITAHMTHPRYEINKTYYAVCEGVLTEEQAQALRDGVLLADGKTAPARVERVTKTKTGQTSCLITIHEGRNRQVRRMLEAVGHKTLLLKRERIGKLHIGKLRPGEWRFATKEELDWMDSILCKDKD